MNEALNFRAMQDQIVLAALPHVPFEGWSRRALIEASKDAGFDPDAAQRAFPAGPVAAVEHLALLADQRLLDEAAAQDLSALKVSERIAWLVRRRLEGWSGHREAIRRAVSLFGLPGHGAAALRTTWHTVDAIWQAAGDKSTDFSYYSRRLTLAAVYSATTLCWLEDESEGFAETWLFLGRRLREVGQIPKIRANATRRIKALPNPLYLLAKKKAGRARRF